VTDGLRIGYLIQDFPPEVGAGPARAVEMSHYWQSHGAEVTVITAMPNRRIPGRGDGVIDPRYRGRFFVREEWEGVATMRSWLYTSARRGFAHTVANNATFTVTALAHGLIRRPKLDVLIASSPPFLPLASGVGLSRILGVPLVIELRDLWPDYLEQMGMVSSRVALRAVFALERWLLRRAQRVVVVTESFRGRVIDKGVPAERIDVIPNGVDLTQYYASDEPPPLEALKKAPGEFIAGYLGTFGRGQGLAGVVEAAGIVAKTDRRIRFVLAGDGPDRAAVVSAIAMHGATNVSLSPPIPRDQTRAFYNACDVCLVPLAPIPVFQETIPSKIFEAMACERPVIASLSGEGARIVDRSGGGSWVPPGDPTALAHAIHAMKAAPDASRHDMGIRGRQFVKDRYNRSVVAAEYLALLRQIVALR
jgi:colanic acid biosynthesis glycosyl transferase WcaI